MKVISKNKKAFFDYEILKKFTAGLVLTGSEVKSIRNNQVNLKGSYVAPSKDSLIVEGVHISPYQAANQSDYDPSRKRKLLLKKREIEELHKAFSDKGQTIIPLAIGLEGKFIKLEIGIGRGKKSYDKRESIKRKDLDRQLKRMI